MNKLCLRVDFLFITFVNFFNLLSFNCNYIFANEKCDIEIRMGDTCSINGENKVCDIRISIEEVNDSVDRTETENTKLPLKTNDVSTCNGKKESPNSRKRVSFEHSAMLRSACVEGNLELLKSLNFSVGRDIEGNLLSSNN